ncbi:HEAT repeat domain-containing protein [Microbacterium sp. NPDC057659]|uniref:HEAT repeat domain-containing protein n=1 Tax=Microbacterium sp. NPDC057659 TaxID=3346198 RepID=UPI003672B39E
MGLGEAVHAHPRGRALAAAEYLGERELVLWCADLMSGRRVYGAPDAPDAAWLGGAAAEGWGAPARLTTETQYWPRVWAARTLLYVWDDAAIPAVLDGLHDTSWRVREMSLKVALRRDVIQALEPGMRLLDDGTLRVRLAAIRFIGDLGEFEHLEPLNSGTFDDTSERDAADRAVLRAERRLDRPLR